MKDFTVFVFTFVLAAMAAVACFADNSNGDELLKDAAEKQIQNEFNNSQFLTTLNVNKFDRELYFFIIDHSIYNVSIDTWNAFVRNYKSCLQAYRAYKQGWNVEFDDILN